MSVFTSVTQPELEEFLTHYRMGTLVDFQGISEGIENTNYFVNTDQEQAVLTLFENFSAAELPYFLSLMDSIATHTGLSARPYADRHGNLSRILKNKPAAFVRKLSGKSTDTPDVKHCSAVGGALAKIHLATAQFSGFRANDRGAQWWADTATTLVPALDKARANLLAAEIKTQTDLRHSGLQLPTAVIHADLFRDNVLFNDYEISGIIDFYYACNDWMLYDLAVTLNDWCSLDDGSLNIEKAKAILHSYQQVRPIPAEELSYLPMMLRAGALRFWMSRLKDKHFPRAGEITHIKDPDVFMRILQHRIAKERNLAVELF